MSDINPVKMVFTIILLCVSFLVVGCDGSGDDDDDSTPESFTFTDETEVGLDEYVISEPIEVEGINTEATITIEGGEYSINGGEFTDEEGEVNNEDDIRVRVLSSEELTTETEAELTIGGESDIFTVETVDVALIARDGFKSVVFSWPSVDGVAEYRLLEKFGTSEEFVPIGRNLGSGDNGITLELPVHKYDWQNTEYKLEACTTATCSSTDEISIYEYMQRSIGYIKAPNTEENDLFSVIAMSADGNTIAVGAPAEDSGLPGLDRDGGDNTISGSGAVYIYVKDDDSWRLQSYIKSPTPSDGNAFGSSVSLSADGQVLVVGVPFDDSGDFTIDGNELDTTAQDAGAVYVYRRFGSTWFVQNYLKASTGVAGDLFGTQVALSDLGSTLVVASPLASNGTANSGAVYVYAIEGDTWVEKQVISSTAVTEEGFGGSLSISANGERIAVGARYFDASTDGSAITGKAYIFDSENNVWALTAELAASNARHEMEFAYGLDLSADGNTLVVGAPGESSNAFQVDGDQADTSMPAAGAAYVFGFAGGNWTQNAYLKASNSDAADRFGASVAINLSGDNIAVGAPGESSEAVAIHGNGLDNSATDAGAVYIFEKGASWAELNYVKAPNADSGDAFGSLLDLDASGDALVVGSPNEDSDATLLSGSLSNNTANDSGAIYLY